MDQLLPPLAALVAATAILLAALHLGCCLLPVRPHDLTPLEWVALRWLGGAGALGTAIFIVGVWSLTQASIGLLLLGAFFVPAWLRPQAVRECYMAMRVTKVPRGGETCAGLLLLFLLAAGLSRPAGHFGHDGVSYHLLGPSVWLREGRVVPVLDNCLTAFPATVEMLYSAGMALSNDRAPRLIGVLFGAALAVQAGALARLFGVEERWSGWAAASVVAMPAVTAYLTEAYVDVPLACFALAGARLFFVAARGIEYAQAGLFLGFAIGTKYSAIPVAVCTALAGSVLRPPLQPGGPGFPSRAAGGLCALTVAGLVGSPWYVKNWILLGSPLYPPPAFLWGLFPARAWSYHASVAEHLAEYSRASGFGRGLLPFLALPFNLTYHTAAFHGAGGIGLVPLALGPIGLWTRRRDPAARVWALWALLVLAVWFFSYQEARFIQTLFVAAAALGLAGAAVLWQGSRVIGRAGVILTLSVSIAYGGLYLLREQSESLAAVFSARRAEARLDRATRFWTAFRYLNETRAVRKVLILQGVVTPFYLRKPYVKIRGMRGEEPVAGVGTATAALPRLGRWGVSHVLDTRAGGSEYELKPAPPGLELVFEAEIARVYRVR